MNCRAFGEPIARYVGGDLSPNEATALEIHLRTCPGCAELARELEDDRGWLSSRPPEVREVDFAALRSQIRQQIAQPPSRWRWLPAMVSAATLVVFLVVVNYQGDPPLPAVALAPPPAPVMVAATPHPKKVATPQKRLTLEEAMRMFEELEPTQTPPDPDVSESPLEVRIATVDPTVTIILLPESKGDSQ